jgi:NAD-dependent dihydropyrimidine dehydrogenase PreA subunit
MSDELYDQLSDLFNKIGYGGRKGPEMRALLKSLFNEDEARTALNLSPFAPEAPARVAERMGEDPDLMARRLDEMADKGLIYSSSRGGENWYKTIQLVPGIFELQFMKGEVNDRTKKLARLFDDLHKASVPKKDDAASPLAGGPGTHFARVIPIEKTIEQGTEIFPFEEAKKYVEAADTITVSVCYCRHEHRLLDRGCRFPDDVCLQFGAFAKFVKERGFGREITREEALDVLKRSADAGLIHTSSNTREQIDFICNCCTCCCGILAGVSRFGAPVRSLSSNYEVAVDSELCTACGECVETCQMNAVALDDDLPEFDLDRCIGCGVCVHLCPSDALTLKSRSDFVEPPKNFRELMEKQFAPK